MRDRTVSRATVEPWLRLMCGVVAQAVDDLCSPDDITAVDALEFWVSDEPLEWLSLLGYSPDPERALVQALHGDRHVQTYKRKVINSCA